MNNYTNHPYTNENMPRYEVSYTPYSPKPPKKKSGFGGKVVSALLVAALAFGAGYLGASKALEKNETDPAPEIVTPKEKTGDGENTIQSGKGNAAIGDGSVTENVAAIAADSVVEITTEGVRTGSFFFQQIVSGAGSGVILTADGYIGTNHHVVENANKLAVTLRDGTQYDAKLIGSDAKTDLAVIKIEASGLQPAVFGSSSELKVGELAVAIGNPLGQLGGTVTEGIISALDREIAVDDLVMHLLQTSAAINAGNSGGGLFNASGELIGVVNAKSSGEGVEGLGFAIPSDVAKPILEELMKNGYVSGRPTLGINLLDIDDAQTAMMYRVSRLGVYVYSVGLGSNAAEAGIKSGDRIVAVNGVAVSNSSEITQMLEGMKIGDSVELTIERGNSRGTVSLTLQEDRGSAS